MFVQICQRESTYQLISLHSLHNWNRLLYVGWKSPDDYYNRWETIPAAGFPRKYFGGNDVQNGFVYQFRVCVPDPVPTEQMLQIFTLHKVNFLESDVMGILSSDSGNNPYEGKDM